MNRSKLTIPGAANFSRFYGAHTVDYRFRHMSLRVVAYIHLKNTGAVSKTDADRLNREHASLCPGKNTYIASVTTTVSGSSLAATPNTKSASANLSRSVHKMPPVKYTSNISSLGLAQTVISFFPFLAILPTIMYYNYRRRLRRLRRQL